MQWNDPFVDAGFLQARQVVDAIDFTLEDINGQQVSLSDYRGKVVLLYFWATWWTWCRKEVPSLIKLAKKMDKEEFVILGIDIQEKRKTVKKVVEKSGIPFPVLLDITGEVAGQYGIRGTPAHFLVDKKGILRAFAPGYKNMASKESRNLIKFVMDNDW